MDSLSLPWSELLIGLMVLGAVALGYVMGRQTRTGEKMINVPAPKIKKPKPAGPDEDIFMWAQEEGPPEAVETINERG